MQNIQNKVDGVDSLAGEEYSSHKNEPLNAIIASGQTPSLADVYQLAKAIALAATNGDWFTDTGSSSAVNYVHLLPRTGNVTPPFFEPGMRVRFMPSASNTSATVQLKVGSLLAKYLSYKRATSPSSYPPSCPVGTLSASKWYTATYLLHPNGVNYYWSLDAIEGADIGDLAITSRELGSSSVTTSKVATAAITSDKIPDAGIPNAKLASDIQLDKISGGTLSLNIGGYVLVFSETGIRFGSSALYSELTRKGYNVGGTNAPGEIERPFWPCLYEIKSYISSASLSNATTRTDSTGTAHSHRIGQQYIFASNMPTKIPNGAIIYFSSLSYTEMTTGRKIFNVPVVVTAGEGSVNYEILSISILNVKDASVDYIIDTSKDVHLSVLISSASISAS